MEFPDSSGKIPPQPELDASEYVYSHDNMPLFEPGETTLPVVQKSPVKDFPSQIARDFNGLMRVLDGG